MFLFSAALRTIRAARSRTSRHPHIDLDAPAQRPVGGPFLHWVPDRPEGERLAGEYLPLQVDLQQAELSRRARRRR